MNRNFYPIGQKINAIKKGLLKYSEGEETITQHVVMKSYNEKMLLCALVETGKPAFRNMTNRRVNLIQKSNNDFIYLSGVVEEKADLNKRTLHIRLFKASWFIKKSKGNLSWLQEKHVFDDTLSMENLELAS